MEEDVITKTRVMLAVGARPQFVKSAPVIREICSKHKKTIELATVHSGQHYDPEMSQIFFRELRIPTPLANLRAGSGSHAVQTATMMKRLEALMLAVEPDVVLVPGDTNTTLASALTAAKLGIPVAHLEAGLRSGDMGMPEEINRKLTDHCSTLLFAPTRTAIHNLRREGLGKLAHLTGDTMVDALHDATTSIQDRQSAILHRHNLRFREFVLVTLHRPSNVDDPSRLRRIHRSLCEIGRETRVVFPVHPRTRINLDAIGAFRSPRNSGIMFIQPQGYLETLVLLKNASCLLTDSGGMQKESFMLHVPCVTLRRTTEWPETLTCNANRLVYDPKAIPAAILRGALNDKLRESISCLKNPFGDGHASARVAHILETFEHDSRTRRIAE